MKLDVSNFIDQPKFNSLKKKVFLSFQVHPNYYFDNNWYINDVIIYKLVKSLNKLNGLNNFQSINIIFILMLTYE